MMGIAALNPSYGVHSLPGVNIPWAMVKSGHTPHIHRMHAMTIKPSAPETAPARAPSRVSHDAGTDTPVPSAQLLQGRDSITIEHNGRLYVLQKTRQGKLILTK